MANTKDINSTERLLNVIRGVQKSSSGLTDITAGSAPQKIHPDKFSLNFSKVFTGKQRNVVGVDIGREGICLAKMTKSADGRPLLVDQNILSFSGQVDVASGEFHDLLKGGLEAFAGSLNDCDIWALMNVADVNVQHLKIPIVAKNQLENVIYWTAKKENPIDEKDVIFDYEMQGEITDQGIPKYSVMAYSIPRFEVGKLKGIFSSIGVNLAGITIAPFAIQNIFRTKWVNVAENAFASLYIGRDFSRIDIFSKNNLVMTRGIKTGISSMMEAIDESLAETDSAPLEDREQIHKIINDLSVDADMRFMDDNGVLWNDTKISDLITPALERLARQVERTLEYYTTSVGYEKVEKIYVSSIKNPFHRPLLSYLREQLSIASELFDPYQRKNASCGESLTIAQKTAMVPAVGLALSDQKHTPNAIFTYVEKNKEITSKRINRGIFAAFAAILVACFVILALQAITFGRLDARKIKLEKEFSLVEPKLTKEQVTSMVQEVKMRHLANQQYAGKYKGMAIIGELTFLTPENIRLISLRINMPTAGAPVAQKKNVPQTEKGEDVIIEGVVVGDKDTLESTLAQYLMKLENSPMLKSVSLQKSNPVNYKKKEVLRFTINAKIG